MGPPAEAGGHGAPLPFGESGVLTLWGFGRIPSVQCQSELRLHWEVFSNNSVTSSYVPGWGEATPGVPLDSELLEAGGPAFHVLTSPKPATSWALTPGIWRPWDACLEDRCVW